MFRQDRFSGPALLLSALAVLSVLILPLGCKKGTQPDEEAPTASLTNPADGDTVSGTVNVTATASDNVGVTTVDFLIDGTVQGSDNSSPYAYSWNTSGLASGSEHTVQAKAHDEAGNVGSSAEITVTIGAAGGGPTEHCGTISVDETWYAADNPHIVTCDVEVGGTGSPILTLEPGVIVKFNAGTRLRVGQWDPGALIADGTADSAITFTSNVSPAGPGDWYGIELSDNTINAATVLDNCLVEYGGGNGNGNVCCWYSSPTITNCTIRNSSTYGVYCEDEGFTDFSGNTITLNAEYPIRITGEYVRTLGSGNTLTGNTKDGIEVAGSGISTTGTWLNQGVPYVIAGDLELGGTANPVITIAPACTLKFRADTRIRVGQWDPGALVADGSTGQITFTSSISPPSPGDWSGIEFKDQTIDGQTMLRYCLIEYGGGNGYGNIYCSNISSALEIGWCAINYSLHWGIYLDNSNPNIHDCTYLGNIDGDVGP